MGKSVDDLTLVMKAWLVEKMWRRDPTVPPLPFDDTVYKSAKKLRIGCVHAPPRTFRTHCHMIECIAGLVRVMNVSACHRYFVTDGYFQSCPTAVRAVETVVAALKQRPDVELVPFTPPNTARVSAGLFGRALQFCKLYVVTLLLLSPQMVELYYSVMAADGNLRSFKSGLDGETLIPLCMFSLSF